MCIETGASIMKRRKSRKRKFLSDSKTIRLDPMAYEGLIDADALIGVSSIVGTRMNQQDSYDVYKQPFKNYTVAVVCDGMGGLAGGEMASKTAARYVSEKLSDASEAEKLDSVMVRIAKDANTRVRELKTNDGQSLKAGTTMAAAVIKEGELHWCSVGDSKIYIFKDGIFKCLTNEHNYKFLSEQMKNDNSFVYDPNARKDALVSYLGAGELKYIDINQEPIKLADGDVIMLCSDGLYKVLSEEDIVKHLMDDTAPPEETAKNLTSEALRNSRGAQDNTTVVVLRYKEK